MRKPVLASSMLLALALATLPALATTFDYTGTNQSFVVPNTGLYDLIAAGAQGEQGVVLGYDRHQAAASREPVNVPPAAC